MTQSSWPKLKVSFFPRLERETWVPSNTFFLILVFLIYRFLNSCYDRILNKVFSNALCFLGF